MAQSLCLCMSVTGNDSVPATAAALSQSLNAVYYARVLNAIEVAPTPPAILSGTTDSLSRPSLGAKQCMQHAAAPFTLRYLGHEEDWLIRTTTPCFRENRQNVNCCHFC